MSSKGVLDGLVLTANRVMTGVTLWGAAAGCAWAADSQPYVTQLAGSGQADLDAALKSSSDLLNLQATHAVGPFALAGRVRNDYDRLRSALESYGYYDARCRFPCIAPKRKTPSR